MATPPSWAKPDADGAYHNGKAYLFTDNLSAETVVATLAHELSGHKGFQELMTPTAYDSLMRQFNRLVNQGNPIALAAKARAEAAEVYPLPTRKAHGKTTLRRTARRIPAIPINPASNA